MLQNFNEVKSILLSYENNLSQNSLRENNLATMTDQLEQDISNILNQKQQPSSDYLKSVCEKHFRNDLATIAIYTKFKAENINEKNIQQTKEAIKACLDDKKILIDAELDLLKNSPERPHKLSQELDEKLFKDEVENNLRLNPMYKIYIDKETGEIVISDKLGKTEKELIQLDDLKNIQTQDVSSPDYNYLENYSYTSYQELALKLKDETTKSIDQPISKAKLERYEEYKPKIQKATEVEEYLGKE